MVRRNVHCLIIVNCFPVPQERLEVFILTEELPGPQHVPDGLGSLIHWSELTAYLFYTFSSKSMPWSSSQLKRQERWTVTAGGTKQGGSRASPPDEEALSPRWGRQGAAGPHPWGRDPADLTPSDPERWGTPALATTPLKPPALPPMPHGTAGPGATEGVGCSFCPSVPGLSCTAALLEFHGHPGAPL